MPIDSTFRADPQVAAVSSLTNATNSILMSALVNLLPFEL